MAGDKSVRFQGSAQTLDLDNPILIIHDNIDPDNVVLSSLLACIAEAGSEAALPNSVTIREFRTWVAAVDAAGDHTECHSLGTSCITAKV